ncbi:hypothetical protein, partial [Escherichia coli]|uniref:hypothetical protein n=1 Tax=Escherichia coli TaxID=562 RepID=UPI001BDB8D7D
TYGGQFTLTFAETAIPYRLSFFINDNDYRCLAEENLNNTCCIDEYLMPGTSHLALNNCN